MLTVTSPRPSESQLLPRLRELLEERLPSEWDFELQTERADRDRNVDGVLTIGAPDGTTARIAVETRASLYPRDAYAMSSQLGSLWPASPRPRGRIAEIQGYDAALVMTRFLTPRTSEMLKGLGFSYADATGNLRISTRRPAIFIELSGASENPWVEARSQRSLKGSGSAAVVRALLDFRPPYKLRDLAEKAGLALGTASRVVNLLAEEALLTRSDRGSIETVDVGKVVGRWAEDYGMLESNSAAFFLEPRGPKVTLSRLQQYEGRAAVTASFAAFLRAPVATPALLAVYVDQVDKAARQLDLRPAPSGGNVVLLRAPFDLPFVRSWSDQGVEYAALSQVAADLLTSPGRGPSEGEALVEWMEANQDAWRRD
jgi:hypothetical protein